MSPARPIIILDSTPLGLLSKRAGHGEGDLCRAWVKQQVRAGARVYVPEIVVYELRRELLRLNASASLAMVEQFVRFEPDRLLVLNSSALTLAAELWAAVRRQGKPTADAAALDIDVILAAQVLTAGWDVQRDTVVATSNAKHVGLFVPAADWRTI